MSARTAAVPGLRWLQRISLALLLSGCASAPSVQQEVRRFHGGTVEALIAEFGPPAEVLGRREWGRQRYAWHAAGQALAEDVDESSLNPGRRFHARRDCMLRASIDEQGTVLDAGIFGRGC